MRTDRVFLDKVAVVTGGASGIGRALGAELVQRGASVVLADLDGGAAHRAAVDVGKGLANGRVVGVEVDVRDAASVQAMVDRVVADHGRIDLLFNNAGIVIGGVSHTLDPSYWRRVIDVNLMGVVNGVVAVYPHMVAQGRGHIVNTASTAGLAPAVFVAAYTASKHGVVGLTTALRPEAAAHGVRVSVLCPGAVDTPILDNQPPADLPRQLGLHLTGRAYMKVIGLRLMTPERFAASALRGVARNRAIIVVPGSARAAWWMNRLSPSLFDRVGRLMARRVTKAMQPTPS
jgi:NAD(P)-dependent dehydrogenase (short-subunit alcohol dehydrogenase family)